MSFYVDFADKAWWPWSGAAAHILGELVSIGLALLGAFAKHLRAA